MTLNLKNEIRILKELILRTLILIAVLYFFNLPIWFDCVTIILITFPTLYLHLKYSYADRNKTLIIKPESVFLTINNEKFNLKSTNKIIIKGSVGLTRNIIPIFISPNYYNVIFISEEFGEVSISSLVELNLRNEILKSFNNQIIKYDYFLLY